MSLLLVQYKELQSLCFFSHSVYDKDDFGNECDGIF